MNFNRHTAAAILSASVANIDYTRGVLDALGHSILALRLQIAAKDLSIADEKFAAKCLTAEGVVTFGSMLDTPDTPERQAAEEADAALREIFAEVEKLQDEAREWLASKGYDGSPS